MITDFSYQIGRVFERENYMLVTYYAKGYDPVEVGVPLPTETQTDEEAILPYAPQAAWSMQDFNRVKRRIPEVGARGVVSVVPPELSASPALSYEINKVSL